MAGHDETLLVAKHSGETRKRGEEAEEVIVALADGFVDLTEFTEEVADRVTDLGESAVEGFKRVDKRITGVSKSLLERSAAAQESVAEIKAEITTEKAVISANLAEIQCGFQLRYGLLEGSQNRLSTEFLAQKDQFSQRFSAFETDYARVSFVETGFSQLEAHLKARTDEFVQLLAAQSARVPAEWKPMGTWSAGKSYPKNAVINWLGSSYLSLVDDNRSKPSMASPDWQLLARRGGSGSDGLAGTNTSSSGGGSGTVVTGTAGQLGYYAANGNTISFLSTVASRILVSDASGIPTWSLTLPAFTVSSSITFGANGGSVVGTNGGISFSTATTTGVVSFYAPININSTIAGGRVAYFRSNAASAPNAQFVLDSPTNFNSGIVLQENATDKFGIFYNANDSTGSRLPDTLEFYSLVSGTPVVRIHQSAGNVINITSGGTVAFAGTAASTSTGSGSVTFAGGVGIAGALYAANLVSTAGTIVASTPGFSGNQTWNNAAITFTAISFNVTDTASQLGSMLLDLQVGGSSKFSVTKAGGATMSALTAVGSGDMVSIGSASRKLYFAPDSNGLAMFTGPTQTGSGVYINAASNYYAVYTNAAEKLRVDTSGNVRFVSYGAGTLTTDSSGNITATSDARAKNLIAPFTTGLAAIRQLTPQKYSWKKATGLNPDDLNVSLVAQDLIAAGISEAVFTERTTSVFDDFDDGSGKIVKRERKDAQGEVVTQKVPSTYYSVNDRAVIATIVNAIKELANANDSLAGRVSALDGK